MTVVICLSILNFFFVSVFCIVEDIDLTAPQLIQKYDYPVEVHATTTSDGYVLTLHRIPSSGIPVLITHSLVCSSASWVDNMNDSLGFILADEKFDVWLGNFRGNSYTNHSVYSRESHEFWDYTAEDMAEFDLTSFIDYIQTVTNYTKILYIGQSLGTTVGFILFSSKLEYNDKVAGFIALSPVGNVRYSTSPVIHLIRTNGGLIKDALKLLNVNRVLYVPPMIGNLSSSMCPVVGFCENFEYVATGYNPHLLNSTRFPIYAAHCADGTSLKNARFFYQQIKHNILSKYDYGEKDNLQRYGQGTPPSYNLSAITVPTALFSSANDALASPLDVEMLKRQLRSLFSHEIMSDPLHTHADFIWLHPAKEILFGKVVKTLKNLWDNSNAS